MKTVAIIGASNDRGKYGNKAVRAFQRQGYTVYDLNPPDQTENIGFRSCVLLHNRG
jgi:predicted CoA-binding protein